MKTLFWTSVFTLFLLASCNDKNAAVATENTKESTEERNKETALRCINAWDKGDIDEILKHTAEDAVDYGDGSTPPARGMDTVKMFMELWRSSVQDYKSENELAVSDGDYVFIYSDWSGTFKTDFMGMPTAGKSFKFKDVDIFKFNETGKWTEHRAVLFSTMLNKIASTPK